MGQRTAGICYVKVDGQQLEIKGALEAPLAETKKEGVMSTTGPVGYKETPVQPYIKGNAIFTPGFPIDKVVNGKDMTITAEFANGKVYTLSEAVFAGDGIAKAEEGEVEIEFHGMRGVWQ